MKTTRHTLSIAAGLAALAVSIQAGPSQPYFQMMEQIRSEHQRTAHLVSLSTEPSAWVTKAIAAYPLETCVVSGERLGVGGGSLDYVYVQPHQPDRLVRFSSADSVTAFQRNPDLYLKKIDEAAKLRVTP